jgi:hypothetical protein
MIGETIYGYWGAGIEPTVAKVTGYMETEAGDTYFAARETDTNKGWYHEEVA